MFFIVIFLRCEKYCARFERSLYHHSILQDKPRQAKVPCGVPIEALANTRASTETDYSWYTNRHPRVCCQHCSLDSVQNGFSLPRLSVWIRSAVIPACVSAAFTALARLSPKAML